MTDPEFRPLSDDEVDATPPKEVFVDMLTRDIGLNRAIIDLVDNCLDGARKIRGAGDEDDHYEGLQIIISAKEDELSISDNCGGFDVQTAREYAFRIGRPKKAPSVDSSVGQFGLGMKRAFFKLGNWFEVTSKTSSESFRIAVDVEKWVSINELPWRFKFNEVKSDEKRPLEETGTIVKVKNLHETVKSNFSREGYLNSLSREIQSTQKKYLTQGLTILFNETALTATPWTLLTGGGLEPAFAEWSEGEDPKIHIRIYAGITESNPNEAGWYVLCNGRLILEADQSPLTGWAAKKGNKKEMPKYHNQFARFRGFVNFDCVESNKLPWNTTKTSVDENSAVFLRAREKMKEMMRNVIDFLNELDAEIANEEMERPLAAALSNTRPLSVSSITEKKSFSKPAPKGKPAPKKVTITFVREKQIVERLQEVLGAPNATKVGQVAFDMAVKKYLDD